MARANLPYVFFIGYMSIVRVKFSNMVVWQVVV